jgi:hypothetical protein
MKTSIFYLTLLFLTSFISAQENGRSKITFVTASYLQTKESLNYGLVFRGPMLDFGMNWSKHYKSTILSYGYKLGFSLLSTRDVLGANLKIKPLELSYLKEIVNNKFKIGIGPSFKSEYNYQVYPDVQSGYLFWYTNYNVGFTCNSEIPIFDKKIQINFTNSLMGFISRPSKYEDPYYYDIRFSDFVRYAHQDFKFLSFNGFDNSTIELLYKFSPDSRLAISYVFEYFGYYKNPQIQVVENSIRLIFYPKYHETNK